MLKKLMKYEWKGYKKPALILGGILLGITILVAIIILGINPNYDQFAEGFTATTAIFGFLLYYFGIIACTLGASLIILIRFYKTCYTDEAYLTHTLPVTTKQLVTAKTITAILFYLLSLLFILLTVVLLAGVSITHLINLGELQISEFSVEMFAQINAEFEAEMGIDMIGYFGGIGIYCMIGCICGVMINLGCISLGQLYTKHRILGAIIAYFGVTTIMQIIAYVTAIPMYAKLITAEYSETTLSLYSLMAPTYVVSLISSIIIAVIMYFVNIHMMTKRLNLE